MTRQNAIARAATYYASGLLSADLARRVALRTESQEEGRLPELTAYLSEAIAPDVAALGFSTEIFDNPVAGRGPFLIAERHEDSGLPTVLIYGHGDVVRGQDTQWREGLGPWTLTIEEGRWYPQMARHC